MWRKLIKRFKEESGQAMIILAITAVALCGFGALAIDIGRVSVEKGRLQNAADAAAIAGARELPKTMDAKITALDYAGKNNVPENCTTATSPYNGYTNYIQVVCTETLDYTFARILGFETTEISVRAVAKFINQWDGEALPIVNLDDDYTADPNIVAWEKTNPGDFESISNYEVINEDDPETCYFKVDYVNGVTLKKGTVASKKQEIGYVFNQHYPDKPVYALSLKSTIMNRGSVLLEDGTHRSLSGLKNGDVIDLSQLVLLECLFTDYDLQAKKLYLTVLNVYDIANNNFPPDYVNPEGGVVQLVE